MKASAMPGTSRMLRPEEAARHAGIGRTKMYELIRTGQVRSVKIGRSRRIPVDALDRYIDALLDEQGKAAGKAAA